jgi:hypothetical protein
LGTLTGEKICSLPVTPECLAFSPDGVHIAAGGRDHGVHIWDAPKAQASKSIKTPTPGQLNDWWTALGGDGKEAYEAIGQMIASPDPVVAMLKERVQPVQNSDAAAVAKLIAQLDSPVFATRAQAQAALEKMGEGPAKFIAQALQENINLEMRRRLEAIQSKSSVASVASLQQQRAVVTLEWIGTPAARAVLSALADGAPHARLTVEAGAALKRLKE